MYLIFHSAVVDNPSYEGGLQPIRLPAIEDIRIVVAEPHSIYSFAQDKKEALADGQVKSLTFLGHERIEEVIRELYLDIFQNGHNTAAIHIYGNELHLPPIVDLVRAISNTSPSPELLRYLRKVSLFKALIYYVFGPGRISNRIFEVAFFFKKILHIG